MKLGKKIDEENDKKKKEKERKEREEKEKETGESSSGVSSKAVCVSSKPAKRRKTGSNSMFSPTKYESLCDLIVPLTRVSNTYRRKIERMSE